MEASIAAARLIEEYKQHRVRKRRTGGNNASKRPAKASQRPNPLLLLPLLLSILAAWMMLG